MRQRRERHSARSSNADCVRSCARIASGFASSREMHGSVAEACRRSSTTRTGNASGKLPTKGVGDDRDRYQHTRLRSPVGLGVARASVVRHAVAHGRPGVMGNPLAVHPRVHGHCHPPEDLPQDHSEVELRGSKYWNQAMDSRAPSRHSRESGNPSRSTNPEARRLKPSSRLLKSPGIYRPPSTIGQAIEQVDVWLESPVAELLAESAVH